MTLGSVASVPATTPPHAQLQLSHATHVTGAALQQPTQRPCNTTLLSPTPSDIAIVICPLTAVKQQCFSHRAESLNVLTELSQKPVLYDNIFSGTKLLLFASGEQAITSLMLDAGGHSRVCHWANSGHQSALSKVQSESQHQHQHPSDWSLDCIQTRE